MSSTTGKGTRGVLWWIRVRYWREGACLDRGRTRALGGVGVWDKVKDVRKKRNIEKTCALQEKDIVEKMIKGARSGCEGVFIQM